MTGVTNQGVGLGLVAKSGGKSKLLESKKSSKQEFEQTLSNKIQTSEPNRTQDEPIKDTVNKIDDGNIENKDLNIKDLMSESLVPDKTSVKIKKDKMVLSEDEKALKEIEAKNLNILVQKQQAVLNFMDSVESELGIPHEDLHEALAMVLRSDPDLKLNNTAEPLFSYFNLSADEKQIAKKEFEQLQDDIKQLDQQLINPKMTKDPDALRVSLTDLSQRFFMSGSNSSQRLARNAPPIGNSEVMKNLNVKSIQMQGHDPASEKLFSQVSLSDMKTKDASELRDLFANAISNEPQLRVLNNNVEAGSQKDSAESVLQNLNQTLADLNVAVQQKKGMSSYKQATDSDSDITSASDNSDPKANEIDPKTGTLMAKSSDPLKGHQNFTAAAVLGAEVSRASPKQIAENVRLINQNIQQLVKSGGGESKIVMSPEGLGKMQVKVEMLEGKVNVSLAAEKEETMKIIENSSHLLKDGLLKSSLEVGKISFDKSLVGDFKQQDPGPDQRQFQDQARGFLGGFRDENFNRRQDWFYETPTMKSYRSPSSESASIKPIGASESATQATGVKSKKGSGLDLVA